MSFWANVDKSTDGSPSPNADWKKLLEKYGKHTTHEGLERLLDSRDAKLGFQFYVDNADGKMWEKPCFFTHEGEEVDGMEWRTKPIKEDELDENAFDIRLIVQIEGGPIRSIEELTMVSEGGKKFCSYETGLGMLCVRQTEEGHRMFLEPSFDWVKKAVDPWTYQDWLKVVMILLVIIMGSVWLRSLVTDHEM